LLFFFVRRGGGGGGAPCWTNSNYRKNVVFLISSCSMILNFCCDNLNCILFYVTCYYLNNSHIKELCHDSRDRIQIFLQKLSISKFTSTGFLNFQDRPLMSCRHFHFLDSYLSILKQPLFCSCRRYRVVVKEEKCNY
jgi:hypothetical protein